MANSSIQNGDVHSGLSLLKVFHEDLDRLKAFHIDSHHLDLSGLKFVSNLLGSGFALLHVPNPEDHPRLVFRVQSGGLETHPGVCAGDEDRLAREVDIFWNLWDGCCELFDAEGEWSVRVERESVFVAEAERDRRQERHVRGT